MANGTVAKVAPKPKSEGFFSRVLRFLRDSYHETFTKSAWPTATELRQFTLVVIFALLVVSFWIGGIDAVLAKVTEAIGR